MTKAKVDPSELIFASTFWYIDGKRLPKLEDFERMKTVADVMGDLLADYGDELVDGPLTKDEGTQVGIELGFLNIFEKFNITRVDHVNKLVQRPDGSTCTLKQWYKTFAGSPEIISKVRDNQKKIGIYRRSWKEEFEANLITVWKNAGASFPMICPFADENREAS